VGRLLRGTFKLAVIGGLVATLVAAARKLMGGLGPEPGSPEAPQAWPSLVPEPAPAVPAPVEVTPPVATSLADAPPAPPTDTDVAEFTELTPSDAQTD
jgi:hypothetical protein